MKKVIIAAVAFAAATPAVAQDIRPAAPFAGPRVEARIGFDRPVITVEDDVNRESEGQSGVVYGGEAGFDFDLNTLVIGAYAGIEGSSVRTCAEVFGLDEACISAGRNITLGGRLGGMVADRTLLYVKGGYSNGQLRVTYDDFEGIVPNQDERGSLDGFHVGGGAEMLFPNNIYGKLEYVYTNYGTGRNDSADLLRVDLERHQVVAAVGIRF